MKGRIWGAGVYKVTTRAIGYRPRERPWHLFTLRYFGPTRLERSLLAAIHQPQSHQSLGIHHLTAAHLLTAMTANITGARRVATLP